MPVTPLYPASAREIGMVICFVAAVLVAWLAVKLDARRERREREHRKRQMDDLIGEHGKARP